MKIECNKFRKPVLELAIKKAEEYIEEILDNEDKELSKASSVKEEQAIKDKYKKLWGDVNSYIRLVDDVAEGYPHRSYTDDKSLLSTLSRKYLHLNPKYGIPLLKKAYQEYYNLDTMCAYCRKQFISNNRGRNAKYCSDSCRYMAYRKRQREKGIK